jgi:hypothetical protein
VKRFCWVGRRLCICRWVGVNGSEIKKKHQAMKRVFILSFAFLMMGVCVKAQHVDSLERQPSLQEQMRQLQERFSQTFPGMFEGMHIDTSELKNLDLDPSMFKNFGFITDGQNWKQIGPPGGLQDSMLLKLRDGVQLFGMGDDGDFSKMFEQFQKMLPEGFGLSPDGMSADPNVQVTPVEPKPSSPNGTVPKKKGKAAKKTEENKLDSDKKKYKTDDI